MSKLSKASKLASRILGSTSHVGRQNGYNEVNTLTKPELDSALKRRAVWDLQKPISDQVKMIKEALTKSKSPLVETASKSALRHFITRSIYDHLPFTGHELNAFSSARLVLPVYSLYQAPPTRSTVRDVEVVFAGRSNVGKSSLLNALTKSPDLALTSQKPGKTQSLNFYGFDEHILSRQAHLSAALARVFPVDLSRRESSYNSTGSNLTWKGLSNDDSAQIRNGKQNHSHEEKRSLLGNFDMEFVIGERLSGSIALPLSEKQEVMLVDHISKHKLSSGEHIEQMKLPSSVSSLVLLEPDEVIPAKISYSELVLTDLPMLSVVDIPGYGFAKAPKSVVAEWNKLIGAYMRMRSPLRFTCEESYNASSLSQCPSAGSNLKRVFVLLDAGVGMTRNDKDFLAFLSQWSIPTQIVLTKSDRITSQALLHRLTSLQSMLRLSLSENISEAGRDSSVMSFAGPSSSNNNDETMFIPFADVDRATEEEWLEDPNGQAPTGSSLSLDAGESVSDKHQSISHNTTLLPKLSSLVPQILVVSSHEGEGLGALRKAILASCAGLDAPYMSAHFKDSSPLTIDEIGQNASKTDQKKRESLMEVMLASRAQRSK